MKSKTIKNKTIYDIAKMANVSVSTVSKVINDKSGVSLKTRELVMGVIKDNDFSPKTSKTTNDTIGFFTATNYSIKINGFYVHQIFDGVLSEAIMHHQNVVFSDVAFLPKDAGEFKRYCYKRGIHSAIFLLLSSVHEFVLKYGEVIPTVIIGSEFLENPCYIVNAENKLAAKKLTELLIKNNHKKIYFIISCSFLNDHTERYDGYLEALNEADLKSLGIYDFYNQSEMELLSFLKELFKDKKKAPTALVCSNDMSAIKVISCLKILGLKVPDDVSVTGWDDTNFAAHMNPTITTVKQSERKLGETAASILLNKHINKNEPEVKKIVIDSEIVVRESVKKLI